MTRIKGWGLALILAMPALPLRADGLNDAYKAFEKGQFEDAAKGFQDHTKKQPHDYDQLYNTGVALFQKGDYAEASNYFDQAKQSPDPQLKSRAAYNKGVAAAQQQHWEQAEAEFQEALSYDNDNVMIQENLKFAREQKNRQKQETAQNQPNNEPQKQEKDSKEGDQKESRQDAQGNAANAEQKQAQNEDAAGAKDKPSDQQSMSEDKKESGSQQKSAEQNQQAVEKGNMGQPESKEGKAQQEQQASMTQQDPQGQEQQKGASLQPGDAKDGKKDGQRVLTIKDLKKQEAEKLLRSVDDRIGTYILTPEQANTEGKSRNGKDW